MGQQESSLGSAGYVLSSATGSLHRASPSSAPSSAPNGSMTRRRLDMRWGRLTMDQLRDEEFLTKQLRRMETLLGANARRQHATSTGRNALASSSSSSNGNASASRVVFVGATPSRLSLQQRLIHGKAGDSASSASPDDQGDDSALTGGLESDRPAASTKQWELLADGELDIRKELDLLNALYLFGELEQPELAALMLQKLKELLLRLCTFPDPFYDLLALRRYILRGVHEAVQVQHQHQRTLMNLSSAALESIRNAILQAQVPQVNLLPSARGYNGTPLSLVTARRRSAATARISGMDAASSPLTSGILLPPIKPKEKVAREASMGIHVVFTLFTSMIEQSSTLLAQRKEILSELLPLIQDLPPQSLAPESLTQTPSNSRGTQRLTTGRGISSSNGVLGLTVASESQELVDRIQRFLLEICPTPPLRPGPSSPKVQAVVPSTGEFDVADRTNAVNALIFLAAARSSLRDFLLAVKVILGAGEYSTDTKESHQPAAVSPRLASPLMSSVPLLKAKVEDQHPASRENGEWEQEDAGVVAPRHKSRVDAGIAIDLKLGVSKFVQSSHRADPEVLLSSTQDLVNQVKRKALPKGFVPKAIGSTSTSTTVNVVLAHPVAHHHHRFTSSPIASAVTGGYKSRMKEDLKELLQNGNAAFSLDMSMMQDTSSSSRDGFASANVTSRHDGLVQTVKCPKLKPLSVCSVLHELDIAKASVPQKPTRSNPRASSHQVSRGIQSGDLHGDNMLLPGEDDCEDKEVWSCGQNSYGELGHGDTITRKSFDRIEALQRKDVMQVSAGNEHSIVLCSDGTVFTCGYNDNGQCGVGVTNRVGSITEIHKFGEHMIAQVHAYNGCEHSVIVTEEGRAATFGYNYRGQLGHGNTTSENVPKLVRSLEARIVRLVSCSYYHTILTCDEVGGGREYVYTFGRNDYGQLGHNDTIDRKVPHFIETLAEQHIVSVACGQYHTIVVSSSGKAYGFGKNDYGQLGIDSIDNQLVPVQVRSGLEKHVCLEIRCGYYHSIVLCSGAHLFGFGRNDYGQLGLGKANATPAANLQLQQQRFAAPQLIEELEGKEIIRFACGCYHTVAVSDSGMLYVFGRNNHGQLGTGDTTEKLFPFPIEDFLGKRIAMVAAGFYHTIVLTGGKEEEKCDQDAEDNGNGDDESSGDGQSLLSSAFVLAAHNVRQILDRNAAPLAFEGEDNGKEPEKIKQKEKNHRAAEVADACANPCWNPDEEDCRDEDDSRQKGRSLPEAATSIEESSDDVLGESSSSSTKHKINGVDSIDAAVIILAELDRLCKPYLPKHGVYPALQHPGSEAMELLQASTKTSPSTVTAFDICGLFDGCFEAHVVHTCSSTFESLCVLLKHLSGKKIEHLSRMQHHGSSSTQTTRASIQGISSIQLQVYILLACIRLLQANLTQLLRSGLGKTILLTAQARDHHVSTAELPSSMKELERILAVLHQIGDVLMSLVDMKQRSFSIFGAEADTASHEMAAKIASEAVETLMLGFELFFPCPCEQRQLFLYVVENHNESTMGCGVCRGGDEDRTKQSRMTELYPRSRKLLLGPLLRRMAEDSLVVKWLSLAASSSTKVTKMISATSANSKPLSVITTVYTALLERIGTDFMRAIGESAHFDEKVSAVAAGTKGTAANSSRSNLFNVLIVFQKHISTWASSCERWLMKIDAFTADPGLSMADKVAVLIDRVFRVDSHDLDDVPLPWRCFLEFAQAVLCQCCDVFMQVMSRESVPSPIFGHASTRPAPAASYGDEHRAIDRSLLELVEASIVGQVLPSVVSSLLVFSNNPLFAVALLPHTKNLLHLLDDFNQRSLEIRGIDRALGQKPQSRGSAGSLSSRGRPSLTSKMGLLRGIGGAASSGSGATIGEVVSLPWSYLLEKEVAVLAAEMAVTLKIADPLFGFDTSQGEPTNVSRQWLSSSLFSGGLTTSFIRRSIKQSGNPEMVISDATRIVQHVPLWTNSKAEPSMSSDTRPFSLVLPPHRFARRSNEDAAMWRHGVHTPAEANVDTYTNVFSGVSIGNFLVCMSGDQRIGDCCLKAWFLCDWIRAHYAKTNASYRMLTRQTKPTAAATTPAARLQDESCIEYAVFAAMLHQNQLAHQALHFALSLDSAAMTPSRPPPKVFLSLWHFVAELRRRFSAKKTEIKNSIISGSGMALLPERDSLTAVLKLQRTIVDRSQLLLLVSIQEESEHEQLMLDGGFVSPCDSPVCETESSSSVYYASLRSLKKHMETVYLDHQVPFLVAFPTSKWRKVRILVHVMTRWRWIARAWQAQKKSHISSEILDFLTTDEAVESPTAVNLLLVDPCRRASCVAQGLESMCEVLSIPSFEAIQTDVVHRFSQVVVFQSHAIDLSLTRPKSLNVGVFFKEQYDEALSEFLTQVTKAIVKKSQALFASVPVASCESEILLKCRLLIMLLSCWAMHFKVAHFEFVNDVGILSILQEISLYILKFKQSSLATSGGSSNNMGSSDQNVVLDTSKSFDRLTDTLWTLFRHICVHFAVQAARNGEDSTGASRAITTAIGVPIEPALSDIFDLIFDQTLEIAQTVISSAGRSCGVVEDVISKESIPETARANSSVPTSTTMRRSFEIIWTPKRFSSLSKGLSFTYEEMIASPSGSSPNRPAMSPLVKPNEFSITTWIYASEMPEMTTGDSPMSARLTPREQEPRFVFMRGNHREVAPYLILVPESDNNWHFEVGMLINLRPEVGGMAPSSSSANVSKYIVHERMTSKESVTLRKWIHVAIVCEASKIRLYINGILDTQRNLLQAHATALSCASVDLPFHFGRCPASLVPPGEQLTEMSPLTSVHPVVSSLRLLASTLASKSTFSRNSSSLSVSESGTEALQSFDGALSNFRFHNRSLSPIHVRIVYDEKKQNASTSAGTPRAILPVARTEAHTHKKLLDQLAVLLLLSSSSEGQLHFSEHAARWLKLLWEVFIKIDELRVQQSVLRVLRAILPQQSPLVLYNILVGDMKGLLTASDEIHAALGFISREDTFVQQMIRIIGFTVCKCPHSSVEESASHHSEEQHIVQLPWTLMLPAGIHGNELSPPRDELKAANWNLQDDMEKQDHTASIQSLALGNELIGLLQHLYASTAAAGSREWRDSIERTILRQMAGAREVSASNIVQQPKQLLRIGQRVVSLDVIRRMETFASFHVISGVVDFMRPGAVIELSQAGDVAHVIAVDPVASKSSPSAVERSTAKRQLAYVVTCDVHHRHSRGRDSQPTWGGDAYDPWYERVLSYSCLRHSDPDLQGVELDTAATRPRYLCVNAEDIQPVRTIASSKLSTSFAPSILYARRSETKNFLTNLVPVLTSACLPQLDPEFEELPGSSSSGQLMLIQYQSSSVTLKALAQVSASSESAQALLTNTALVDRVLNLSTSQDGNASFATCAEIERKVSLLRQRLYKVLIDMEDEGDLELQQLLLRSSRAAQRRLSSEIVDFKSERRATRDSISPEKALEDKEAISSILNERELRRSRRASEQKIDDGPASQADNETANDDEGQILDDISTVAKEDEDDADENDNENEDEDELEDDEEEDEEEDEGDEDEDEDEDDEDAEENRAEFVEELMLMGFPEEWCILALKQTENDIVCASAWIVDNLEYLSRLQTSLDKQRDRGRETPRFDEEEDDNVAEDGGDADAVNGSEAQDSSVRAAGLAGDYSLEDITATKSNTALSKPSVACAIPPLNDKEMARKVFGEMYFPFEDGGYRSNTRHCFMRSWRGAAVEMKLLSLAKSENSLENSDSNALFRDNVQELSQYRSFISQMDLKMLVNTLQDLEHTLSVLYARQCMVTLCYHISRLGDQIDAAPVYRMDYPQFFQLVKMILLRGNQFNLIIQSDDGSCYLQEQTPEHVLSLAIAYFLRHDFNAFVLAVLDFSVSEIEKAASNKTFDAHLWTQRELTRADKAVHDEPAIEMVSWIVDVVLKESSGKAWRSSQVISQLLRRLRFSLKSANLPLKFLGLHMISVILQKIYKKKGDNGRFDLARDDSILIESKLEVDDFLHAAKQRHAREVVQHRLVFSLYLQAYIEILHVLLKLTGHVDSKPGICGLSGSPFTSLSSPLVKASITNGQSRSLAFDRKRCRSNLLTISDDGGSVTYSGNEVWKTVFATESFSTGVVSWQVRIEKSGSSYLFVGVGNQRASSDSFLGADDHSWGYIGDKALYYQRNRVKAYGDNFGEGDCIGVTLDCERGTLSFTKNGIDLDVAFDNIVGEVSPAVAFYSRHQRVSLVPESLIVDQETGNAQTELVEDHKVGETEDRIPGNVEEALVVCELMTTMINKEPVREQLLRSAYEMTTQWMVGSKKYVTTRTGKPLWVDITRDKCSAFGFQSGERVRTCRGNGVVVGVAEKRLWVEVDGEQGAWFFHPSKLRSLTLISVSTSRALVTDQDKLSSSIESAPSFNATDSTNEPSLLAIPGSDSLSFTEFQTFVNDPRWSLAIDREILSILNDYCETSSVSPWNVSPSDALDIIRQKESELEGLLSRAGFVSPSLSMKKADFEAKLVNRMGFLRFFNACFSRVVAYFDLTWHYFAPDASLLPCKLVSKCRGSLFIALKNEFFTALMEKTANSPKKADDDYDYPEDVPQVMVNRPKAATAKCHPGTTKSLFLSLFGQAFEELHFLPLRTLRMVYSHPMDDGQLRSFKVKFEGEGVDDYGGPYREFFSQFFAELQMLRTEHEDDSSDGNQPSGSGSPTTESKIEETPTECLLPFLLPSPNWRNGVGANREKFVINAALLREPSQAMEAANEQVNQSRHKTATGANRKNKKQQRDDANAAADLEQENPEEKRQLHGEMFFFLGQMLGTCLRTRVCVRLDLAISVWKHLAGEVEDDSDDFIGSDSEQEEAALQNLKEVDFVAYTLWKTLRGVLTEHQKLQALGVVGRNDRRVQDLEEQLEAMDLTFTTFLSDGHVIELCENGNTKVVSLDNLESYLQAVLRARADESNDVMNIIKQGLNSILPVTALGLFTWRELEKRVCGVAEVDVELLKANTEYDEDVSPQDEFVQRFWRALAAMDEEDKRCFLRFVWARSRLPAGTAQFHQKFKIQSVASSTSGANGDNGSSGSSGAWMDSQLPKSHTCFFALQLPRYSSDEICMKQMLYAVRNCVEMDGDFRLADTEMTGWNDIDPTDQLRF